MGKLVPEWRLREVRNIADALAFRAGCCPVSRFLMLAEKKYLEANAHIRLLVHPGLSVGEARTFIQKFKATNIDAKYPVDLFEVTIYFNGDLTSKENWEKTSRDIVQQLGWVIFFSPAGSPAARDIVEGADQEAFLEIFVDEVLKEHPFTLDTTRPRFTLAKLEQIVKEELHPKTEEVLQHMSKLLLPYLGPDGW